jgi:tetratricopeptide (TPR) repeat protein
LPTSPDAVFWWSFYERRSSDEFFESALTFVAGKEVAALASSAAARAEIIASLLLLHKRRYLFVLDGFEVMQHEDGDQYGSASSDDLQRFLTLLAAPNHASFALLTSRTPLLDLANYTTYRQHDVTRLSRIDGRALLREVGVRGSEDKIDAVVESWDGHALTISLIGSYLKERFDGDVAHIGEIPPPTADEDRYNRVHRVLRRYDEHLDDKEKAFLKLFSAFRLPVKDSAFAKIFRPKIEKKPGALGSLVGQKPKLESVSTNPLNAPLTTLDDAAFDALVQRLVARRMIRPIVVDSETTPPLYEMERGAGGEDAFTAHPLVRAHYSTLLATERGAAKTHQDIAAYYQTIARRDMPRFPTMDDLAPYIEVVHHLCQAGAYDEAWKVSRDQVDQGAQFVLIHQLGAYETELSLMLEFFPNGDTIQESQVSKPSNESWILNVVGLCLMSLGRLAEAAPFYERQNVITLSISDWHNTAITYQNLASLYIYLGALERSAESAREALRLAGKVTDERNRQRDERDSLAYLAWAQHLMSPVGARRALPPSSDDPESPAARFARAEALEQAIDPSVRYLYSNRGIFHVDYLRRTGEADYARRVTDANLEICERNGWQFQISQCHRVLGDLDADAGQQADARGHYDTALRIARGISYRPALIEALLARGRWYARYMHEPQAAFSDLNEALDTATTSGYRRYEADIRVGLAWAHLRAGNIDAARGEAQRAKTMSHEMHYYWGQADADEVLKEMEGK